MKLMGYEMEENLSADGENLSAVEIMMSPGKVESRGFKGWFQSTRLLPPFLYYFLWFVEYLYIYPVNQTFCLC